MNWDHPVLHPQVSNLLSSLFAAPTAVQFQLFQQFPSHYCLIVSSQTGSGKTIAFSAPIVSKLLQNKSFDNPKVKCLVLCPTRQLALQTIQQFNKIIPQAYRRNIVSLVGGLSQEKQKRLLQYAVVVVGTPGRILQLLEDNQLDLQQVQNIVIDQADRMVQLGAFRQLDTILGTLFKQQQNRWQYKKLEKDIEDVQMSGVMEIPYQQFINSNLNLKQLEALANTKTKKKTSSKKTLAPKLRRCIFVSATLTKQFKNTKHYQKGFKKMKGKNKQQKQDQLIPKLQAALSRVNCQSPKIIDVQSDFPKGLTQFKCFCDFQQKLMYIIGFLRHNHFSTQKTIIFVNKIQHTKHLSQQLYLLKVPNLTLHSQMQQRQRLQKVQKFISQYPVLITTDLAARGLDINVDFVIQSAIPRDGDTYIHRVGRTARAGRSGKSLMVVAKEEGKTWRLLNQELKRQMSIFQLNQKEYYQLKQQTQKAFSAWQIQSKINKIDSQKNWDRAAADQLGLGDSSDQQGPVQRLQAKKVLKKKLKVERQRSREVKKQSDKRVFKKGRVFLSPNDIIRLSKQM